MVRTWFQRLTGTDMIMLALAAVISVGIVVGSIATLTSGKYTGEQWEDLVVFGLAQGSIYALIALGYTLVYGILRMINFAHSEVFMSGPFTAYFLARALNTSGFLRQNPLVGML